MRTKFIHLFLVYVTSISDIQIWHMLISYAIFPKIDTTTKCDIALKWWLACGRARPPCSSLLVSWPRAGAACEALANRSIRPGSGWRAALALLTSDLSPFGGGPAHLGVAPHLYALSLLFYRQPK